MCVSSQLIRFSIKIKAAAPGTLTCCSDCFPSSRIPSSINFPSSSSPCSQSFCYGGSSRKFALNTWTSSSYYGILVVPLSRFQHCQGLGKGVSFLSSPGDFSFSSRTCIWAFTHQPREGDPNTQNLCTLAWLFLCVPV